MTRSLFLACLVCTSLSAGSADETPGCPVGSEGSCKGPTYAGGDNSVLLQAKMEYEAEVQQSEACADNEAPMQSWPFSTCAQQKAKGSCNRAGKPRDQYCRKTCGVCSQDGNGYEWYKDSEFPSGAYGKIEGKQIHAPGSSVDACYKATKLRGECAQNYFSYRPDLGDWGCMCSTRDYPDGKPTFYSGQAYINANNKVWKIKKDYERAAAGAAGPEKRLTAANNRGVDECFNTAKNDAECVGDYFSYGSSKGCSCKTEGKLKPLGGDGSYYTMTMPKTLAECMAEQICFKNHGSTEKDWVKKCVICNPNVDQDEQCRHYRECIRQRRGTLSDKSVQLLKNIDIVTGQVPQNNVAVLELRHSFVKQRDAARGCTDPSSQAFVTMMKSDCNCLQDFHAKCDGAHDQQNCLRQVACKSADVCQAWKNGNCGSLLLEEGNQTNQVAVSTLLAQSQSHTDKSLDESLSGKRTCG